MKVESNSVIVFDGACVLCSRWVSFVLRHDRRGVFRFAAMQSATGHDLLREHGIDPHDPVSFLLLEQGRAYTDTDAIARVLLNFGFLWRSIARSMRIVPRPMRDASYRWLARNRYRFFGRREVCLVPSASDAERFLS
ncbi:MAG: thiol-disulfide oxidoreductase DCC family protein [Xanthomonadaceae bacterium]|nr:thiol-disulfide oxidoreductase DCC family protein [Xanthomonadaceae bacterium]